MKKKYIAPVTENVNVRLFGSVLGGMDVTPGSPVTPIADGKQDDFTMDDDGFIPDLWGDEEEEDF